MNQIQPDFLRRFPPNERYLVGLSGGRDSVALLHWLLEAGYQKLIACHLNHHLRGRASGADARFVQKLVDRYDVNLVVGSANVRALATKQKMSIEAAGREARYKFFARVAKRRRLRAIFLAHHADDVVETVSEAVERLHGSSELPTTFFSGPSATADIEMTRIKGVHGPRFLDIILLT